MMRNERETPSPLRDVGATAVEYAIMASLIAAVVAATVLLIGQAVNAMFVPVPGWL